MQYGVRKLMASDLTSVLARRVMKWTSAPGRFLTGNRRWQPDWRFQPERNLNDAFRLLEAANPCEYAMGAKAGGEFWCWVNISGVVREARDASMPRAITYAVARAAGIDVEAKH